MPNFNRPRLFAIAAVVGVGLSACGGGSESEAESSGPPSGEILVLTNRTDVVDTVFQDYAAEFNKEYPDVEVKFQALTDYAGEVKTRMSTSDYGDVLLVPADISGTDLPDFFEPLGATDELGEKYRFIEQKAVDGQAYGIATFGNANGFVYNKKVFEEAGITEWATTPEEMLTNLEAIKANTDAIPYYTNYKDGWPLSWPNSLIGAVSGDPEAAVNMAESDAPWAAGEEMEQIDSLLYSMVEDGLSEDDPTTTNWEESKSLLGKGEIAMMPLGSWALPQMAEAAEKAGASADDIGFMPAPFQVDGAFNSPIGPDYMMGINSNSENKKAARAWLDFFVDESGYYEFAGGVPTQQDLPMPTNLSELTDAGVNFVDMTPSPKRDEINNESEIGIGDPDPYRALVDSARGAKDESKEDIYTGWNEKWSTARASMSE